MESPVDDGVAFYERGALTLDGCRVRELYSLHHQKNGDRCEHVTCGPRDGKLRFGYGPRANASNVGARVFPV